MHYFLKNQTLVLNYYFNHLYLFTIYEYWFFLLPTDYRHHVVCKNFFANYTKRLSQAHFYTFTSFFHFWKTFLWPFKQVLNFRKLLWVGKSDINNEWVLAKSTHDLLCSVSTLQLLDFAWQAGVLLNGTENSIVHSRKESMKLIWFKTLRIWKYWGLRGTQFL